MDPYIDLPVPPLCAVRPETSVARGERMVVELADGRKLIGKLERFDGDKGIIGIRVDGGGDKHKNLGMHEIRLLRVPQPRKWLPDDDATLTHNKVAHPSAEPLEFDIEFSDHSSINGTTFGFRNGRHGIHLFPVQDDHQYTHLFVPNNAIARHRIGKHLARAPVADGVAPAPAAAPPAQVTPAAATAAEQTAVQEDVVALLRELILDAVRQDVTAVHFEPTHKAGAQIRLRKNGELGQHGTLGAETWSRLLAELKAMTRFDQPGHGGNQAGTLDSGFLQGSALELRIYYIATADGGHDVTLKITAFGRSPALADMGLSDTNLQRLDEATLRGHGLLVICGTADAGASTLMHALLRHINTGYKKIWLLGDTVHSLPADVRQVRSLGRHQHEREHAVDALFAADPDLVLIHNLSDAYLAARAVSASLAGPPQILATLAARSAGEAVERLINMAIPRYELVDALSIVVAQGVAKALCAACKKRYVPTTDELRGLATEYNAELVAADEPPARLHTLRDKTFGTWHERCAVGEQPTLYRAVGCKQCRRTGYDGRLPLHELLELSVPVRRAVLEGANAHAITRIAIAAGMKTLRQDGIDKALQGHIDLIQARAACSR